MILFNGASGGIGRYLGQVLEGGGIRHRVLTTRLEHATELPAELSGLGFEDESPIVLIHLAAIVSVPRCEENPELAWAVNVNDGATYVRSFLGWSQTNRHRPYVLYVSSGHVYAAPQPGELVTEDAPTEPRSVYARTKLAAEAALTELAVDLGCPLTVGRVFGLIAPGQPPNYLLPALIDRVRRGDVHDIPGLSNVRDYLDARDVAAHILDLAEWTKDQVGAEPTTVNICSGVPVRVRDVLEAVIGALHGIGTPEATAVRSAVTEAPDRPTDITWLVGSPAKQQRLTGRPPQSISLEATVRDAIKIP